MRALLWAGVPVLVLLMGGQATMNAADRIIIQPVAGKMMCNAIVPKLSGQVFGLGIPETIGCREQMWLVNHPDVHIEWEVDGETGVVSTSWTDGTTMTYAVRLIPDDDHVDIEMSITNLSNETWHDVFSFNCVSPARAPDLKDPKLVHTYMSVDGQPKLLSETSRIRGHMPTVGVYLPYNHEQHVPLFAKAFEATSPNRTDASWLVAVSDSNNTYMATTTPDASFLFNNTELGCLHASPNFGTLAPGEKRTVVSRVYMAHGNLSDFLIRHAEDQAAKSPR